MSYADERNKRTAEDFEQQLEQLLAQAHEDGTDVSGAYVTELDETTDVEILVTGVER